MTLTNDLANWAGTGSNTSVLIANGANIGIGTTSPAYPLHVRKDNTAVTTWITSDNRTATGSYGSGFLSIAANGTNYSYMTQGADGNQYIINALSTGSIIMQTGGTVNFVVGSNGNVGISNTNPAAKLHVHSTTLPMIISSSSGSSSMLEFQDGAVTTNKWRIGSGTDTTTDGKFFIYDQRQTATRMVVDTGGNMGIGISSPGAKLDVAGSQWIRGAAAAGAILVTTADPTSGLNGVSLAASFATGTYGPIKFFTSNAEAMRIDSSGNVGIGTTTPGAKLDIQSSSAGTATGLLKLYATNGSDRYAGIDFHAVTSETYNKIAQITAQTTNGGNGTGAAIGGDLIFRTNSSATNVPTERVRIDSSGRVTKPYQPRFSGYPTTDYSAGSMPTGVILFTANFNVGSNYNASTGRFTAPVTGYYKTTWGGLQLINTVTSLQVNGADINNGNHFAGSYGPNYITMTQTNIVYLGAGDYLTIRGWNGGGYYNSWYNWTVELVG